MKTNWMMPSAILALSFACSSTHFGGSSGNRSGNGAVDPSHGFQNPPAAPLDISSMEVNQGIPNGPKPGSGAVLDQSINLDCDTAQGVTVDVGGKPSTPVALLGADSTATPSKGNVNIDKNGNPSGPNDPTKGGKGSDPNNGKGDEPFPPAPPIIVPPTSHVVATVNGKFCTKSQNKLTVLFVVDYSGSMGAHVDQAGGTALAGNDPQINGSCGRLQAAQAIIQKIHDTKAPTDQVQIGLLPFAGGVVVGSVVGLVDFDTFAAQYVSPKTFCSYIIQDSSFGVDPQNPGGVDGTAMGVDASTNYVAAFTGAATLLGSTYGHKVMYFISDGEPTRPGNGSVATDLTVQASVGAGAALRAAVDNLTMNAVLLQNQDLGTHAQDILSQVAGSPNQVVLAANADQLATQIMQFSPNAIDPATVTATLVAAPYPQATLGILSFGQDPAQPAVWSYQTQAFDLLGTPGTLTPNIVRITAKGLDGTNYSATVTINYRE